MRLSKNILVFAAAAFVLAASGAVYFSKRGPRSVSGASAGDSSATHAAGPPLAAPQATGQNAPSGEIAETITSFLGTLTPGGAAESAGRESNYVITYQVAFIRMVAEEKLPEENLSYKELMDKDPAGLAPYVFYGENIRGTYDPGHPDTIAVRAIIDDKDVRGYIDAQKLWLEPPMAPADSPRYMALKDVTAIHVVPDAGSPVVLSILQGEVVEAVGKLSFKGEEWIKARFNGDGRSRYGFLKASDLQALTPATVNQSAASLEEIPRQIRGSDISLIDADRQRLSQNGLYIEAIPPRQPIYVDDMVDFYQDGRWGQQFFITSDLFLHVHHLLFDRMLQDVEETKLFPAVSTFAANLAQTAQTELKALPQTTSVDVRGALTYDLLYFSVAAKLFDSSFAVPDPVRADAETLVSKIQEGAGSLPSASSSGFSDDDFTQYKPRGHYEKNETLQRYFRGMMWFGRTDFLLADRKLTLSAILIPWLAEKAGTTQKLESIDHSLGYLVGPQDKYTLGEYRSINRKIFGTETPDASQVGVKLDQNLQAFEHAIESDLPAPQIVSVQTGLGKTQQERLKMVRGFKLLGQRYTLDAFFMNQLTSPSVGTDENPRNLPSALDVMMLLGSGAATEQQQQIQQQQKWANYDSQTKKLQSVAQEHLAKQSSFYEAWLNVLNSLFLSPASKQLFALRKPWQYKNLNAGAASWTELKHDTILYAEQSAAEQGGGEEFTIPPYVPPAPKGYVEPNPLFFRRQGQAIDQMLDRLKPTGFVPDEYLDKFTTFRELVRKAEAIAQEEVSGDAVSAEDFLWIQDLRENLGPELVLPRGAQEINDPSELQMGLIADVATDAVEGRVLEVGIGAPQRITVLVKDAYGGTRLTIGYVYSWYEFSSTRRWADSEWKKVIYSGDPAAEKQNGIELPGWYAMFVRSPGGAN